MNWTLISESVPPVIVVLLMWIWWRIERLGKKLDKLNGTVQDHEIRLSVHERSGAEKR